ncbi:TRAP dicarboxylate transporter, DctM subunit, unknown substrate 6 [hydrothermal vent metagenome]|uniref:TRAP C4-dicarboxylate transport system permease DctM subunit domain-containing protein n=1 Tax=hydrothermal vent metagenome TaxID=652676 RepID=A0A3B1APJ3_9ZZZZ
MPEVMAILLFITICVVLLFGYPVAFTLGGVALIFAGIGMLTGTYDDHLGFLPSRLFGIISAQILFAVPLFVFMGIMLERSKVAEQLLDTMALLFGPLRGGLGISVVLVGMLLAASTGIVGATVVTMGLLSLPTMIKRGYDPKVSSGLICASGTLGQIIPPSIILILLGDVLSTANQQAQSALQNYTPEPVSVGDLFAGALIPGLMLVAMYILYIIYLAIFKPQAVPALPKSERNMSKLVLFKKTITVLLPPLGLIVAVLGSILVGAATPTEAASVGAVGAMLLAIFQKQFNLEILKQVMQNTTRITSMVFLIFIGASIFSLVFRGFHGDQAIANFLTSLPGGVISAMIVVMLLMFLLGFILDFIEITFVVVPIVAPILLTMGLDPIWLGVMIAINLQTSFLTPPFGFSLFYLRGVAPPSLATKDIYKGVMPFIAIQIIGLVILSIWPSLVTWLPSVIYG